MRVIIMLVGIVIMLIVLPIRPSLAQNMGCLRRISNCLNVADDAVGCCPTFKEEIENERECFCLVMDRLQQNASTASALEVYLFQCGIIDSLETLCSGTTSSSPAAQPASSPSDSTSSSPSLPSTPSPRSPSSSTPTKKSTAAPPPTDSGSCWKRIGTCMDDATVPSEAVKCCALIKEEIANERECFCVAKTTIREDPSVASGFSKLFTICSIPGSFDTICPDGPPSSLTPTTPMTLPPRASTDTHSNSKNATTTETASASQSGSTKKFAYSVGLLPSSLLIIWALIG